MKKKNVIERKCFDCIYCKQTINCMQCKHKNANPKGRGGYCYPNSYDDCDCDGFEKKSNI